MKPIRLVIMLVLFSCAFGSIDALAGDVFGISDVIYDYPNNRTRGYHKTQLDYDTADYYTAYVCGELYKDGVYQVRSCQSGILSATRWTEYTGTSVLGSVLSDHYVDMKYFDEEQQSYIDYEGYRFLPGSSYLGEWLFSPAEIFGYRNPVSIHLGSTTNLAPFVTLNAFGSWTPDTVNATTPSEITISVTSSSGMPSSAAVSLNFGYTVSGGGSVDFGVVPAEGSANPFSFSISSNQQKSVTAKYTPTNVTLAQNAPNVVASCNLSATPAPPATPAVLVQGSPQTSTSILHIR